MPVQYSQGFPAGEIGATGMYITRRGIKLKENRGNNESGKMAETNGQYARCLDGTVSI